MSRDLLSEAMHDDDFNNDEQLALIKETKSEEDIDAMLEVFEEEAEKDEPGATDTSSKPAELDPEKDTPEEKNTSTEEKPEESKATEEKVTEGAETKPEVEEKPVIEDEEKKEGEPEKGTSPTGINLDQIVTDEVISQFDEKDRAILSKYKDKPVKEYFKALINSQRKIGERNILNQEVKIPEKEIEPTQIIKTEPEGVKDVNEVVEGAVFDRMKKIYPDMPKQGTEEYEDWVSDLKEDVDAYIDFRENKKEMAKTVQKQIQDIQYVHGNSKELNKKAMEQNADRLRTEFKKMGVEDPKEIGYDLEIKVDEQGYPYNDALNNLLDDGAGKIDASLFTNEYGVPLVLNNALANKFILNNSAEIVQKLTELNTKKQLEKLNELKGDIPKSLNAHSSGTKDPVKVNISEMKDPKQIDAILEELESQS